MDQIERLIAQRPSFHNNETEVQRPFTASESLLPHPAASRIATPGLSNYAIGADVLRFIASSVGPQSQTLETGAGSSTLVFALRQARHVAITPSPEEIGRIKDYAEQQKDISLATVQFVAKPSEEYLPNSGHSNLDLVLLDGKHAFPWPIIDWFYTADRLRHGGLLLLDDIQLPSVGVLAEFLRVDPGWILCEIFSNTTAVFRKAKDRVHDIAWHMQPWTVGVRQAVPRGAV